MPETNTQNIDTHTGPETREAVRSPHAVSAAIEGVERALGQRDPMPDNLTEGDIISKDRERGDVDTTVFRDFRDVTAHFSMIARLKAAQVDASGMRDEAMVKEWVLANRQATYNEYFPMAVEQLTGAMRLFEQDVRDMLPLLPAKERAQLAVDRERIVLYLARVQLLLQERTKLASYREISKKIVDAGGKPSMFKQREELLERRRQLVATMTPESRAIVEQDEKDFDRLSFENYDDKRKAIFLAAQERFQRHVYGIENELIETLKGNPTGKDIPGAPKGFLPQLTYIKLLQARYTQIQQIQTEVAGSRQDVEHIKAAQAELGAIRRDAMRRMMALTQLLEAHQVSAAEISSMQEQFGTRIDLDAHVSLPYKTTSPDAVHGQAEKIFEGRAGAPGTKQFHLDRLEAMVTTADTAFSPKGLEAMTEESAMGITDNVDELSKAIRSIATLKGILPENDMTTSVNDWFDKVFPLYLNESLDAAVTADGTKATRAEKLQRIRQVILRFRDTGSVARFKSTIALIKALPPAETFVGDDVQGGVMAALENGRVDGNPVGMKIVVGGQEVTVNGATAYALLFRQMRRDSEEFNGSYREFLDGMDRVVDLRLGLIAEKNIIQDNWGTVSAILGTGAGAGLIGALAGPYVLKKGVSWASSGVKSGYKITASSAGPLFALQGARTYLDYQEWKEVSATIEADKTRMIAELRAAGFTPDASKDPDVFTYEHDGVKCTISIKEMDAAMQGKNMAAGMRLGASGLELAYLARAGLLRSGGKAAAAAGGRMLARAVPAFMVVEAVVETYVYTKNQAANRAFLSKCPPWLIAKLATKQTQFVDAEGGVRERSSIQQTIGNTPYEYLSTSSEAMISDWGLDNADQNKAELRKKMVFAIMHKELEEFPELLDDFYPAGRSALAMDQFYATDFDEVFMKFFKARIYQSAKGNVSWEQAKEGRISGDSYVPSVFGRGETPDTPEVDVRAAIREAAALTSAHMKEKRYTDVLDMQKRYAALPEDKKDPAIVRLLDEAVRSAGEVTILDKRLADSGVGSARGTRIQSIADTLYAQAGYDDFKVDVSGLPGMKGAIDFSDPAAVRDAFVSSKVMRMRMADTHARTFAERDDKHLNDHWSGTPYHVRIVTDQIAKTWESPVGYAGLDIDTEVSFAQAASDFVRQELGKASLRPGLTVWNALGASDEQPTAPALRGSITRDAVALFESEKGVAERRAGMARSARLETALKTNAFVFEVGSPDARMCSSMMLGAAMVQNTLGPVVGVLFEGRTLKSGSEHSAVLGTFVFKDEQTGEVTIAQSASASGSVVRLGTRAVTGGFVFPDARTLQTKPGMDILLKGIRTGEVDREKQHKIDEEAAKARRWEQDRAWDDASAQRDALVADKEALRAKAIDAARKSSGLAYVPGGYVRDDSTKTLYEHPGDYRANIDGWDVAVRSLPEYPVRPSMGERRETTGTRHPADHERYAFDMKKDGKDLPPIKVGFDTLPKLDAEKQSVVRGVLTRRFDVTGHPQAKDPAFLQHVRSHEIERIVNMATFSSSYDASAEAVRGTFFRDVLALYEKCPDAKRQAFLGTLYDALKGSPDDPIYWGRFGWHTFGKAKDALKAYAE
jgi:hypothetical protein